MRHFHFVLISHPRLRFRDAETRVVGFLQRRLARAGAPSAIVAPTRAEAQQAVGRLLAERTEGYVVLHDAMNPLVDLELVGRMAEALERNDAAMARCDGAVPGTQVEAVYSASRLDAFPVAPPQRCIEVRSFSQDRHNNQFNLYKYKRLKIFLALESTLGGMEAMTVEGFVRALGEPEVFRRLAAFCENAELVEYDSCPHCGGSLVPLGLRMSQPFCGYLPSARPLYHECEGCGLILASPAVHEKDVPSLYDEWDRQDFAVTLNNPYHATAPRCDFSAIEASLPGRVQTLDLGGGMGRFSEFLKQAHPDWDVTHSDFEIKRNPQLEALGIRTRALNFLREPIGSAEFDLITAWEVLEHVPFHRLAGVLESIHAALAPGGYFVFSTPDFDSPLCRSMDFFGICPPFHFLVFGEKWLREYFRRTGGWEYLPPRACSDFLDDALMWYEYGARTCPSMQMRATAQVMRAVFENDRAGELKRALLSRGFGTEVIVTLRKADDRPRRVSKVTA